MRWAVNYRTVTTEYHRKIPVRARSRHEGRVTVNGFLDGRHDQSHQGSVGWYEKKMDKQ